MSKILLRVESDPEDHPDDLHDLAAQLRPIATVTTPVDVVPAGVGAATLIAAPGSTVAITAAVSIVWAYLQRNRERRATIEFNDQELRLESYDGDEIERVLLQLQSVHVTDPVSSTVSNGDRGEPEIRRVAPEVLTEDLRAFGLAPTAHSDRVEASATDDRPLMGKGAFAAILIATTAALIAVVAGTISLATDSVALGIVAVGVALAGALMILGASIAARRSVRPRAHSESDS